MSGILFPTLSRLLIVLVVSFRHVVHRSRELAVRAHQSLGSILGFRISRCHRVCRWCRLCICLRDDIRSQSRFTLRTKRRGSLVTDYDPSDFPFVILSGSCLMKNRR